MSGTLKQETRSLLRCGQKQARLTRETQQRVEEYVRGARAAGASWQVIGAALGITRQSAWERFRHLSVDAVQGATTSQRSLPPQLSLAELWEIERVKLYVRAARASGESWQTIGTRLGISRQWAWERFRHLLTPPRKQHSYEPVPEAVLQARNRQPDEFANWVIDAAKVDRQIEKWLRKPNAQLGVYASRSDAIPPINLLGTQVLRTFLLVVSYIDGAPVQPRGSVSCPICGRSYLDDSFLERHKNSAHRNPSKWNGASDPAALAVDSPSAR